jgi:hypothetical protein
MRHFYDAEKYKNSWVKASNDSEFFTFSSDLEDLVVFVEYYADQDLEKYNQ